MKCVTKQIEQLHNSPGLFGFNAKEDAEWYSILNKPTHLLHTALFWGTCTHQLFPIKFYFLQEVPLGICNACHETLQRLFYSAFTPTCMLLQAFYPREE